MLLSGGGEPAGWGFTQFPLGWHWLSRAQCCAQKPVEESQNCTRNGAFEHPASDVQVRRQ